MAVSTSKFNYIDCDPDLCIGCQICEYVCSYTKTGEYNTIIIIRKYNVVKNNIL